MKLSISVFSNWLSQYSVTEQIKDDAPTIETIRVLQPNLEKKGNTLYVGLEHENDPSSRIVCIHNNNRLLLENSDFQSVMNSVINAIEFYAMWESQMITLLSENCTLQDLVDASEDVLKAPVLLLDVGQRMAAMSRKYTPENDSQWQRIAQYGTSESKFLIKLNHIYPNRITLKDLYHFPRGVFPNDEYQLNFFLQDEWIGNANIISISKDQPLSSGTLTLFRVFCAFVDRWYQNHLEIHSRTNIQYQLISAVKNPDCERDELLYLLRIRGWEMDDPLMMARLFMENSARKYNRHICEVLNSHTYGLLAAAEENSVCIICNLRLEGWPSLQQELKTWIVHPRCYCCTSPVFHLSDSFYPYYQYTEIASQQCPKVPGELYDGRNIFIKYLIQQSQEFFSFDICHPAAARLKEYDKRHHTCYFHTLDVYLNHERNHNATAEALNLHRNSLTYRLKKISELLNDVDLNDPQVRLHMLLSFESMR